jgi:thiol:disulfide interchange protein DsbD
MSPPRRGRTIPESEMSVWRSAQRWMAGLAGARRPAASGAAATLALLLIAAAPQARAVDEADLLPVDQAFALSATAPQRDRIGLQWKIAPGYYLYRHRISVQVEAGGFTAGTLEMPRGDRHHDEFFGDVETYRDVLRATLPGEAAPDASRIVLKVKYQGCADAGVCYPPQVRTVAVTLPAGASPLPSLSAPRAGALQLPGLDAPGATDAAPLPDAQAFVFEAIAGSPSSLLLRFTPAPGYYLYRDRSSFRVRGAPGIVAGEPRWPAGVSHRDEHFGDTIVYFDQVEVPLPLQRPAGPATTIELQATFQGCQAGGICYPPMTRTVAVRLPAATVATTTATATDAGTTPTSAAAAPSSADVTGGASPGAATATAPGGETVAVAAAGDAAAPLAEDSRIAQSLSGHGRWLALLGFFVVGLGLAFTPCVLPMVPILSGLIAGQGTRLGTGRALWLSFVYVLANALVFTAAGVVAGLLGANLQAAFQKPWIIGAFAALFVALALSSFGLYELQLPRGVRSRLGLLGDRQRGGSVAGVAAMGALSALIVGPCVAPPLVGAVAYIGQSHDPVLGGTALFLLAMGMGAPLLVFGGAAGRGLPTSGPWMLTVQRAFGFLFLGLAVWMLSRIVPATATLALWGLLGLAAAAWASTVATVSPRARAGMRFAALVLAVAGAAELLGAFAGGNDPLRPLAGLRGGATTEQAPAFRTIKSSADLDRELAAAAASGTPVLFDFYADWCVSCKEMERYTFTDPAVASAMRGFVLLKADVTANDDVDQALMRRFGIIGPPGTLFFADGQELRGLRLVGFERAAPFRERLQRAAGGR